MMFHPMMLVRDIIIEMTVQQTVEFFSNRTSDVYVSGAAAATMVPLLASKLRAENVLFVVRKQSADKYVWRDHALKFVGSAPCETDLHAAAVFVSKDGFLISLYKPTSWKGEGWLAGHHNPDFGKFLGQLRLISQNSAHER